MPAARTRELVDCFCQAYGVDPTGGVRAPGRVNLIGEHTDYNDGFCLPMAIERDMRILYSPRSDTTVRVVDVGLPGEGIREFELAAEIPKDPSCTWLDYLKGCAVELIRAGRAPVGCDLAIGGDVPLGSGLSSSAALEVATILALLAAADDQLEPVEVARLGQAAENAYVGNRCGILDQLASACCREGQAVLMDCRDLSLVPVPLPPEAAIVIADTGKRRGLVDSAYNERRSQCETGAAGLGVSHLRDVDLHALRRAVAAGAIDDATFRRSAHVVAENGRTRAAAACLQAGDLSACGALMDASHDDLRARFEVTCPELDAMAGIGRELDGCYGSRMTGAGFGGCTVHLVRAERADAFANGLLAAYRHRFPDLDAAAYVTGAAAGAGPLALAM